MERLQTSSTIDWNYARTFLRRQLSRLSSPDESWVEDLVQEALVRVLRRSREGSVGNLDALMTTIAKRTWIDHLRRQKIRERTMVPLEPLEGVVALPSVGEDAPGEAGDIQARLRFFVLEYLWARSSRCYELACAFFEDRDWQSVAKETGATYAAVRQQWSRCVRLVRAVLLKNPELVYG